MKKVLLVDDDRESIEIVSEKLRSSGYEVVAVQDGRRAVEAARAARPDLIVLDILMPNLDGNEVGLLLRSEPDLRSIPIVYLTNLVSRREVVGGANAVVSKMNLADLVGRIARILEAA